MGWSGGTEIAQGVWNAVKDYIPDNKKPEVATEIVDVLEDQDWDNLYEVEELYELTGRKERDEAEEAEWERKWKEKNQY